MKILYGWIVATDEGFHCQRCEVTRLPGLPCVVPVYFNALQEFINEHKECKEVEIAKKTEEA